MKTGFNNELDPSIHEKSQPNSKIWNFEQPPYDERSSCYVNAGCKRGVGHTQKIGKEKAVPSGAVPFGRIKTLSIEPDEAA